MKGSELKALLSFADGPSGDRPVLQCVHFTESYAEAANGFVLGRVYYGEDERPEGIPFCVNLHRVKWGAKDEVILSHKEGKVSVTVGPASYTLDASDLTYPNTDAIWINYQPYARVCLAPNNMIVAAGLVSSQGPANGVILEYTTPSAGVKFVSTNKRVQGIIMPVYMQDSRKLPAEPTQADKVNNLLKLARIALRGDGEGKEKALAALDDFLGVEE